MKKRLLTILIIIALLSGLSLLLYPLLSDFFNNVNRAGDIRTYTTAVSEMDEAASDALWESAEAYNRQLAQKPAHWKLTPSEIAEYEEQLDVAGRGIMAYVEIPKLNCSLPVYHGTNEEVLQIAVGHLAGSSLPVGGVSTHCVLSGHRGLPSAKLFTNLDKLVEGDVFSVKTLGKTLTYEVDQISIVLPEDTSKLQIVHGSDLCTLMTCTPYGVNTHRLLVRGHRVDAAREAAQSVTADALQIDPLIAAAVLAVPAAIVLLLGMFIYHRMRKV